MLPYGRQTIDSNDIEAVITTLQGDWLTTGPAVEEFESEVSALTGGFPVVSSTSGTAALHIAYAAAGIGLHSQVITTPMTFVATSAMASILGARIEFADICLDTGLIDPLSVEAIASEKTSAITAVDYAGQPADYQALQDTANSVGAITIDDAAHSVGGFQNGKPVGSLSDITTLSFFPTKNFTTGEGGAVIFRKQDLAQAGREFHNIGLVRDPARFELTDQGPWHQEVHAFGVNYRLTDIGSALGLAQLKRLSAFKRRRQEIVDRYNQAFQAIDGLVPPVCLPGNDPMWHLYPLRILDGRRLEVFTAMREREIGVQVNYMPVYWHPVYANMGYKRGMCPNAERYYEEELSLPLYPSLTDHEVDRVVEEVLGIIG